MKKINWKRLIVIIIITFVVGSFFSFFTMNNIDTFKELEKPINVPGILFPIVWSILYLLMSISLYIVIDKNRNSLIIYSIQLIINSLWTLIFFGFGAYLLAFIWIILLLIAIVIMIAKFYNIDKKAAYLNIPYLLWVLVAAYLNLGIYLLNK